MPSPPSESKCMVDAVEVSISWRRRRIRGGRGPVPLGVRTELRLSGLNVTPKGCTLCLGKARTRDSKFGDLQCGVTVVNGTQCQSIGLGVPQHTNIPSPFPAHLPQHTQQFVGGFPQQQHSALCWPKLGIGSKCLPIGLKPLKVCNTSAATQKTTPLGAQLVV